MGTAVMIENLFLQYGTRSVLSGVSMKVEEREFLGIIGPNGGGKTTLLRAMLGLVEPSAGRITVFGVSPRQGKHLVGYVPQFASMNRSFPITVGEVVMTGMLEPRLWPFVRYSRRDREERDRLLELVGLHRLKDRQVFALSGGEYQRMLLARALAVKPRLLLLDEPTANVDAVAQSQIYELLAELNKDITIIIVTHDLLAVSSYVGTLACLNRKLVYHGDKELNESIISELYGCPVDLIAHGVPHRVLRHHGEVSS